MTGVSTKLYNYNNCKSCIENLITFIYKTKYLVLLLELWEYCQHDNDVPTEVWDNELRIFKLPFAGAPNAIAATELGQSIKLSELTPTGTCIWNLDTKQISNTIQR